MEEIKVLEDWTTFFLVIAAICTTSFPVVYAFSRWYASLLGRLLMFQSIVLATTIDLSLLFRYWLPDNVVLLYWVGFALFGLIALSSLLLTLMLIKMNYMKRHNHQP